LSQNKDLVGIYVARGEAEAQVIKSLLESYGIPSVFKTQAALSTYVFAVDGMGQVSVMVRAEDAEAAQELVKGEENV
jgi:type IV secretory pathway TrbF-like protein